jgi:hypothetical protein
LPRSTCKPIPLGCQLKQNETNFNDCTLSRVSLHMKSLPKLIVPCMCKGDYLNRWRQTVSDSAYLFFRPTKTADMDVSISLRRSNSTNLVPKTMARGTSRNLPTTHTSAYIATANAHVTAVFNFAPLQDNLLWLLRVCHSLSPICPACEFWREHHDAQSVRARPRFTDAPGLDRNNWACGGQGQGCLGPPGATPAAQGGPGGLLNGARGRRGGGEHFCTAPRTNHAHAAGAPRHGHKSRMSYPGHLPK